LTTKTPSGDPEPGATPQFEHRSTSQFAQSPKHPNLDPILLDAEMSNYFIGAQYSHHPPPYTEIDLPTSHLTQDNLDWLQHFNDPYDDFITQPLPSEPDINTIDPCLFSLVQPNPPTIPPATFFSVEPPAPKAQSPASSVRRATSPVKWFSRGRQLQRGGKYPPTLNTPRLPPPPKRLSPSCDDATRYEINVETGLETVKRIKLVFREGRTPSLATEAEECDSPRTNELGLDENTPSLVTEAEERESPGANELMLDENTPMLVTEEEECESPRANELRLDENTPMLATEAEDCEPLRTNELGLDENTPMLATEAEECEPLRTNELGLDENTPSLATEAGERELPRAHELGLDENTPPLRHGRGPWSEVRVVVPWKGIDRAEFPFS
jgi:hypothetical protein